MKFITPIPIVWNEVYKNLQQYWINELEQKMSPPPKPLILAGWNFSNDIDKRERWKSTIKWANENNCEHLIPELKEDQKYYVQEFSN